MFEISKKELNTIYKEYKTLSKKADTEGLTNYEAKRLAFLEYFLDQVTYYLRGLSEDLDLTKGDVLKMKASLLVKSKEFLQASKAAAALFLASTVLVGSAKGCSKKRNLDATSEIQVEDVTLPETKVEYPEPVGTVERLEDVAGYNEAYKNDYQALMNKYDLDYLQVVDYVNRAYEIQSVNFFKEALISEVAELLMAIDDGSLVMEPNHSIQNNINMVFNQPLNEQIMGNVSAESYDIVRMMPNFFPENSDARAFLSYYATLCEKALQNQYDEANIAEAYQYLQIFTYNLFNNGHTETDVLSNDATFNENATVTDEYDWYILLESFVKPTVSFFTPYANGDPAMQKWLDLECMMESVIDYSSVQDLCRKKGE